MSDLNADKRCNLCGEKFLLHESRLQYGSEQDCFYEHEARDGCIDALKSKRAALERENAELKINVLESDRRNDELQAALIAKPHEPKPARQWRFHRFVDGVLKAEGAKVHADSHEEAARKAAALFGNQARVVFALDYRPSEKGGSHSSDCAIYNEPALPAAPCDCKLSKNTEDLVQNKFSTRTLGGCPNCSQPIGGLHLAGCESARPASNTKVGCKNFQMRGGEFCGNCGYHITEHNL